MKATPDEGIDPADGFCIVPNWLVDDRPDMTAPMLRLFVFLRRRVNFNRTDGWAESQPDLADAMGLSPGAVNKTMRALEQFHREHKADEPCPGDGTCTQAVVKLPGNRGGWNGWCSYWLDASLVQVAPSGQKRHSAPPGSSHCADPVDDSSHHPSSEHESPGRAPCQKRPDRMVENDQTAWSKTTVQKKNTSEEHLPQEHPTTGHIVRCDEQDQSAGPLLDETRSALHQHLVDRAVAYGVSLTYIRSHPNWRPMQWKGWDLAVEEPERVDAIIDFVFDECTKRTSRGFCWAGVVGTSGVRRLRDTWVVLEAEHEAHRAKADGEEPDSRERAEEMGWWEPS